MKAEGDEQHSRPQRLVEATMSLDPGNTLEVKGSEYYNGIYLEYGEF